MARPEKPEGERTEPRSVSLTKGQWMYLVALANEIVANKVAAERARGADPLEERATTSDAIRHLIGRDQEERRKDEQGRPVFIAGPEGQTRAIDMTTGSSHYRIKVGDAVLAIDGMMTATVTGKPAGKKRR